MIMRTISMYLTLLVFGGIVFSVSSVGATNENLLEKKGLNQDYISWVNNQKKTIESTKAKLRKVDIHLVPGTDNGGEASIFVNETGRPKHIYVGIGGSSSWATWDFYYDGSGKLILVLAGERKFKVNKEGTGLVTDITPIHYPKESYYLKNGKVIDAKDGSGKDLGLSKAKINKRGKFFQLMNETVLESFKKGETDCDFEDVIGSPYNRAD